MPLHTFVKHASSITWLLVLGATLCPAHAATSPDWISLLDEHSLEHWRASEHEGTWSNENGWLVAKGPRSHLFYEGPVADHQFRNFELQAEVKTEPGTNSGIHFHTRYQPRGCPDPGHEVQINNSPPPPNNPDELYQTGSLSGVRNIYRSCAQDTEWFTVRVKVVGGRIRIWVNQYLTVDYPAPSSPSEKETGSDRAFGRGTIALRSDNETGGVVFRRLAVKLLPETADPLAEPRASDTGYGLKPNQLERLSRAHIPFIDFHVHLRGGMTIRKAIARQAVTGINVGVLRNLGTGWPLETDQQLQAFLDSVTNRPVFVGVQVNDRDWYKKHSPELLNQLDYVLGDTMIMPMPNDDSPPVKLFQPDKYTIKDPDAWMKRYVHHNLRVLSEPITILANPTWLPAPVSDQYHRLWTDERMKTIIQAAIDNHVALEINARSGYPRERFVRLARKMGAKFSFGSNNFSDRHHDMSRCVEAIAKYGLTRDDIYVPGR